MLQIGWVSRRIGFGKLRNLCLNLLRRTAVVQVGTIGKLHLIPRLDGHEFNMVFKPLAQQCEQLLEQHGCGQHCGASVVAKCLTFGMTDKLSRPSAGHAQAINHCGVYAACSKTKRCSQTTKTGPDDNSRAGCSRNAIFTVRVKKEIRSQAVNGHRSMPQIYARVKYREADTRNPPEVLPC